MVQCNVRPMNDARDAPRSKEDERQMIGWMPGDEPRKRHCGRCVTRQRPTEVEWGVLCTQYTTMAG
jgi:hypothetical protein